jgi:hypothetical protein
MEEPSRKRVRLDPEAQSSLATRANDDIAISLEVDHMILDYLIYQAIKTCLANPHHPSSDYDDDMSPVDRCMSQVDDFLALFKMRYPDYKLDAEIRFRQLLLQAVVLFTQRLTSNNNTPSQSSLFALRKQDRNRAQSWIETADGQPVLNFPVDRFASDLPLPTAHLASNREHVLRTNSTASGDIYHTDYYGTSSSLSLLDLLPLFMKLSAVFQNLLNISVSKIWCELALEWMLQACLEQYLIYGSSGRAVLDQAFAWGYNRVNKGNKDEDMINEIFRDDEREGEIPGWKEMRQRTLQKLCPTGEENGELCERLQDLAVGYPMRRTEETILEYLKGLSQSIPEPVLVQLEKGQLAGMTAEQTQEFMRECGLDKEWAM